PADDVPEILCNLPPFQPIAARILALDWDDASSLEDLVRAIESDSAFSAELLHVANSPLYSLLSNVQTIRHAVVVLGLDRTREMALTLAMRSYFQTGLRTPAVRKCWRHSLACAVIAGEIAPASGLPKDLPYTAGLLHDIGRLGLIRASQGAYLGLLETTYEILADHLQAERQLFGFDHCQAGAWLARVWGLPDSISEIAQGHHDLSRLDTPAVLRTVQVACQLADALGYAAVDCATTQTAFRGMELERLEPIVRNRIEGLDG
ncbi:MAG: HDOD domain-containing protein, partial [Acidobacteria bacterium]|nr:HDOD domain-containing protein [Acidobacteriota bacterium]